MQAKNKALGFNMPKLKTHRGAAKRFRKTASGFKRKQTNKNHILTKKTTKRKRHLRGMEVVADADAGALKTLLPKKAR